MSIAFMFAGQGAQAVGMGKDFYETVPAAARVFRMGEALRPGITALCFNGDSADLNRTENAQPSLFLTDLAIAASLRDAGVVPSAVAGFSLGEIPAMAFAGVMNEEDAFRFVLLRGDSMAKAAARHPGGMVAVLKLPPETVAALCRGFSEIWPVNYNCPGQVSCAGSLAEIDDFCTAVKNAGGRAVKLPVSGAFHTPYMEEVSSVLGGFLHNTALNAPSVPLYANRTAEVYPSDPSGIAERLTEQVCSPVLWEKTLHAMRERGTDIFVEVGAGSTLSGFVRRTLPDVKVLTVNDTASFHAALNELTGV